MKREINLSQLQSRQLQENLRWHKRLNHIVVDEQEVYEQARKESLVRQEFPENDY